jgi:hypothetical protein
MNPPENATKSPAKMEVESLEFEPDPRDMPAPPRFASREDWLAAAGHLAEEERHVDGLGWLLLGEIGADVRADITTDQSAVLLAPEGEVRKLDRRAYERRLLLHGVLDPASPEGNRLPLLQPADIDRVFKIGGAKIGVVIDTIERLSMLGRYMQSAEGNSNGTQSSAGT